MGRKRWNPTYDDDCPISRAAAHYASLVHTGQRRADGSQFILHPLEVASLLERVGAPDHLVAAGVLHDVLEKAEVSASELRRRFGTRIAGLVVAVSDDDQIDSYSERKAALRRQVAGAGVEVLTLFAADKLSKLRELRRELAYDRGRHHAPSRRRELPARRLRHYERSLALLEDRLSDSPLVRELHDELDAYLGNRAAQAA